MRFVENSQRLGGQRTLVWLCLAVTACSLDAGEPQSTGELRPVAQPRAEFTKPPEKIPSRMHPHDAPLFGNGNLTVAMAGKPEYFAELTATCFAGKSCFPGDRAALKACESEGYALMEGLWGLGGVPGADKP
jgi:hypothetical protein